MAHANKRISVILGIVAFLFILTIILLIIPYEGTSHDPWTSDSQKGEEHTQSPTPTSLSSTTTSTTTQKSAIDEVPLTSTTFLPINKTEIPLASSSTTQIHTTLQDKDIATSEASTQKHFTTTNYTKTTENVSEITSTEHPSDEWTYSTSDTNENYDTSTNAGIDASTNASTDASTDSSTVANINMSSTYSSVTDNPTTDVSVESTSVSTQVKKSMPETFNTSISENAASKQVAASMLHLMNHSADPCQDFYEYSCGNGVDNLYLSPVNPKDAVMKRIKDAVLLSPMENPAHIFYESCLDKTTPSKEDRIDYIRQLVWNLGEIDPRPELPEVKKSSYDYIDDEPFDFTTVLATMMKHHFTPFFDMTIDVDDSASLFVLKLTPPLFHSPLTEDVRQYTCLNDYYKKMDDKSASDLDELYKVYKDCSAIDGLGISAFTHGTLSSVKKMNLLETVTGKESRAKVENSILFDVAGKYAEYDKDFAEEAILQLFPDPSDLRQRLINRDYTLYNLQDMDNGDLHLSNFSWHGLVEELLDRSIDPAATSVQVYFPDEINAVLKKLNVSMLDDTDTPKLRNVLLSMWTHYLDSSVFDPVGPRDTHTPHTEDYCLRLVTELMPDITSQLYLGSFDPDSLKAQMTKVKDMTKYVKAAIKNQFSGKRSNLAEKILEKIDSMKFDIGQELFDRHLTSSDIYPMETLNRTDFPRNVIQLLNRSRSTLYSFLDQNPNDTSIMWQLSNLPYSTTGSTLYPLNTALIPIGSFESPFYKHGVPDLINYAGLGKMMSQEMMHAFDFKGVEYEFSQIPEDSNVVASSGNCQKQQLRNVHTLKINDNSVNVSLPTELLVNEALSDSSSVYLAWRAYLASTKGEISGSEQGPDINGITNDPSTQLSEVHEENTDYYVETLPYMDSDVMKQFYIRSAQIHCEKTSKVNIINLKENEHLPGTLRVNHMARNDPFFKQTFGCEVTDPMVEVPQCRYIPLNNP